MRKWRVITSAAVLASVNAIGASSAMAQRPEDIIKKVVPGIAIDILKDAARQQRLQQRSPVIVRPPSAITPPMVRSLVDPPSAPRVASQSSGDADEALVRDMQLALIAARFSIGQIDGVWGPKARAAAKDIQAQIGHPRTGWLTPSQLFYLKERNAGRNPERPPVDPSLPMVDDEDYTKRMQRALRNADFDVGDIDGRWGSGARAAARSYQARIGQPQTGRLTFQQLVALESGGRTVPGNAPPVAVIPPPPVAAAPAPSRNPAIQSANRPANFGFPRQTVSAGSIQADLAIHGFSCSTELTAVVNTTSGRLFANEQVELRKLTDRIVETVHAKCPDVQTISVRGLLEGRAVYLGSLTKADPWQLTTTDEPIATALTELRRVPATVAGLKIVSEQLINYAMRYDGSDTVDWRKLKAESESLVPQIAERAFDAFQGDLLKLPITVDGFYHLRTTLASQVEQVERLSPDHHPRYRTAHEDRRAAMLAAALQPIKADIERQSITWENAFDLNREVDKRLKEWRPVVEIAAYLEDVSSRIRRVVDESFAGFVDQIKATPATYDGLEALHTMRPRLFMASNTFPKFNDYHDAVMVQRGELIPVVFDAAVADLKEVGAKIADIEAVMEAGSTIVKRMKGSDSIDRTERVNALVADRIGELAKASLPEFTAELEAVPSTRAGAEQLQELLADYAELELSIPSFAAYREAVMARLSGVENRICDGVREKAGLSARMAARQVVVDDDIVTLGEFACAVDRAGYAVSGFTSGWFGWWTGNVWADYTARDGHTVTIAFEPSKESEDTKALVGAKLLSGENVSVLSREAWISLATGAQTPVPTGKPDRHGVTECDLLAADPDDPKKVAPGVPLEGLTAEHLLEACVAALEHDPENPRLQFQLGRVLMASGAEADGMVALRRAAEADYPAANAAIGMTLFLDDSKGAAALSEMKKALAGGYQAVSDQVKLLAELEE